MAMPLQPYLFDWDQVESSSDLDRLRLVLSALPDEALVCSLEKLRGKGRDDYPVRAVWNSLLAGVVFQHPSIEALRRDLQRNGELRALCGFNPTLGMKAVPGDANYSRFLSNLLEQEKLVNAMFHQLVEALREVLPDLGEFQAIDGKAIPSLAAPQSKETLLEKAAAKEKQELPSDRRREDDADFGVKTYQGTRQDGSTWKKVKSWFGFELHLLVDSRHELPLNYKVTKASASETVELLPLDPTKSDTVIFDNKGNVSCICPVTSEQRPMAFWGFESDRDTLKYRCPAAANDFPCQGRDQCPGGDGSYGRTVRIPLEKDRRLFTPTARDSAAWDKSYDRRTSVERVNSRIDNVLGFENHTIRGLKKMQTRVGLALVVMLAMAMGRIRIGQQKEMRSLVRPVVPAQAQAQAQAQAAFAV